MNHQAGYMARRLSGIGDLSSVLGQSVSFNLATSSPPFTYSYQPGQDGPAAPPSTDSPWYTWYVQHVLRPQVTVTTPLGQTTVYDPSAGFADYSQFFNLGLILAGVGTIFGTLWVLGRALERRPV